MKKIIFLQSFFVFLIFLLLSIGGVFSWEILSLWCLHSDKSETPICERFSSIYLYNGVLLSVKSGDNINAQKLFRRISSEDFSKNPEYFELSGDLSYISGDHTGWTIQNYEKSITLWEKERVQKKLDTLKSLPLFPLKMPPSETPTLSASGFSGSDSLIKTEREKIHDDEQNRSKFLSFPNMSDPKAVLQDTIDFVDTGKERIDW